MILIAIVALIGWQFLSRREEGPSKFPYKYRGTYLNLKKILDNFNAYLDFNWDGEEYNVSFGANLLPANLHAGEYMLDKEYYTKTIVYLDALKSLGVKEIHIDIGYPLLSLSYPNFKKYLEFYRKIAQEVKRRG